MSKTKTALAVPDDRQLPAHAVAEIEAAKGKERKALEAWWENWAQVGDAKAAFRDAVMTMVAAEQAFAVCRQDLARLEQRPLGPRECLCGKHAGVIDAAVTDREAARLAIADAELAFKEG